MEKKSDSKRRLTTVKSSKLDVNKKDEIKPPEKFSCVICNQVFSTHNQLINHFRLHGSNEIDIRGRPMLESTMLKHPAKIQKPIEKIECEWCTDTFPNISKAIEHKFRKHRYESTNYFCETCGKLFPLKVALEQHKKTEHLENKLKVEEKKPKFKCKLCPVIFDTEYALNFHQKCIHAVERRLLMPTMCPPPSKKIKMNNSDEIMSIYYCHLCGSEYMLKFNLRKHLEDHHSHEERDTVPKDGIIVCKTCEAIFYSKKAYDAHSVHHRPDDLYVTSEEQRQKIVARIDLDFDIRRVPPSIEKFIPVERQPKKRPRPVETATKQFTPSSTSKFLNEYQKSNDSEDEALSPASIPPDSSDEDVMNIVSKF